MSDKTKKNFKYKKTVTHKLYGGYSSTIKTVGMFIAGMGCSSESFNNSDNKMATKYMFDEFKTYCKPSLIKTLKNIAHATMLKYIPKDNKFVHEIYTILLNYLQQDNTHIYIIGHSYGGAVVATVAQLLQNYIETLDIKTKNLFINKLNSNLTICTFVSIYIPTKIQVKDVPLYNYLYKNDVAIKSMRKYTNTNTTLTNKNYTKYMNVPNNIKSNSWTIHNSYFPLIDNILNKALDKKKLFYNNLYKQSQSYKQLQLYTQIPILKPRLNVYTKPYNIQLPYELIRNI